MSYCAVCGGLYFHQNCDPEEAMPDIGGDSEWVRDKRMSSHMLRRTARAAKERFEVLYGASDKHAPSAYKFEVEPSARGPFGWRVVRFTRRKHG